MLQVHREMQQLEQDQQEQEQQEFLKRKGGMPLQRLRWLASDGLYLLCRGNPDVRMVRTTGADHGMMWTAQAKDCQGS